MIGSGAWCRLADAMSHSARNPAHSLAVAPHSARPRVEGAPLLGTRYRILERLATGGMGELYAAWHADRAEIHAVKVLSPRLARHPELAERITTSEQGRRIRFVLRPGLRFHDGAPLTAADVKRSLERSLHPDTPCPGASLYRMLRGYEAYRSGAAAELAGLVVVDELTIDVVLSEPDATFLALMSLGLAAPICPSSGRSVATHAPTPPCGAGPFRFESWDRAERVVLRRFENYHVAGKPLLDGEHARRDEGEHDEDGREVGRDEVVADEQDQRRRRDGVDNQNAFHGIYPAMRD